MGRGDLAQALGIGATLLLLFAAPAAVLIALWYVFSNTRAAAISFKAARWIVVGLNVVLLVTGFWEFVMITSFNYDGLAAFNKVLLPATLLVIAAGPIKAFIKNRAMH
jgi:hypothetical protein